MKTVEQINTHLAEIRLLLAKETDFLRRNPERKSDKMRRLEGNIGALEWVLEKK